MEIEYTTFKSKAWGIIPLPYAKGHFLTGYEQYWPSYQKSEEEPYLTSYDVNQQFGDVKSNMLIGQNAIITAPFRITSSSRGRSAANFHGFFKDHPQVCYDLSMDGTDALWGLVQSGVFPIVDGHIEGRWTFAKQGQSIFLKPYVAA